MIGYYTIFEATACLSGSLDVTIHKLQGILPQYTKFHNPLPQAFYVWDLGS